MVITEKPTEAPEAPDPVIEEMTRAGLHFGHKTSKTHPKMKPYIEGLKNTVHVFDLKQTKEKLDEVLEEVTKLREEGKMLMLVGTKVQIRSIVKEVGQACGLPYVINRWIGGTFTNFETIFKRIERLNEIEQQKTEGELEKYTKKEQAKIEEERARLEINFGGLKNITKLPDAVFVFDLDKNGLTAKEARMKGIIVLGICDSNIDPTQTDFCIPANDDAVSSVQYIADKLKEAILQAKPKATEEPAENKEA